MNWDSISYDWNHVRAFLATAEEGSLSAAARVLKQSQPTLGRQVAALEEELGVTLFERVGRSLALTQSGLELLDHVRDMGTAASRISLSASGQSQNVDGHVRVTASDILSVHVLPTVLSRLQEKEPGITVEIVSANDFRDLQRREADIAIRHARPTQDELIARKLGDSRASLYASPEFLARHGRPETLEDLTGMPFLGFDNHERLIEELGKAGLAIRLQDIRGSSASGPTVWAMAQAGMGISIMADRVADITGGVERVLPQWGPVEFPVWLCVHRELKTSRRIRLVYDFLADALEGYV